MTSNRIRSLSVFVAAVVALAACSALLLGACGSGKVDVSDSTVLGEMQGNFGTDVTGVKVSGSSSDVRIDVYTIYHADRDVADAAGGMARMAAQSSAVLDKYPSATIEAYVWPAGKEFYMTRATAKYADGKLETPMDVFVNDVLK